MVRKIDHDLDRTDLDRTEDPVHRKEQSNTSFVAMLGAQTTKNAHMEEDNVPTIDYI